MNSQNFINYAKNTTSKSGQTLFKHLTNLVDSEVDPKNPIRGVQKVEVLSNYLKNNDFKFVPPDYDSTINNRKKPLGPFSEYLAKEKKISDKSDSIRNLSGVFPNSFQQTLALKTAGISIGQKNNAIIQKSLKIIMNEFRVNQIRFWGKILGFKDYYVIQGTPHSKNADFVPNHGEQYGTGINSYSYWVTTDILSDWIELPLITPEQLNQSRLIKYIFTGNLENNINQFPIFPGKEKHLLKAQIVRITHSCEIVPKGLYKLNQENNLDFEDQFKVPQVSELNSAESWVHLNPHILNQGRCTHYIDPTLTEEQKQALNAENTEKDPLVQKLKSINEDKPLQKLGYSSNWIIQQAGETQIINQIGKQQGQTMSYGVVLLKNLSWPGAYTVGYSGGWANIYIGYGQKISQNSFNPIQPKDLAIQAEQKLQVKEPNPSNVPVKQQQPKNEDQS